MKRTHVVIVLVGMLLFSASQAVAQGRGSAVAAEPLTSPPVAMSLSADRSDYAGSESCKACHRNKYEAFSSTKMGKILLTAPRNELEGLGCESCHGPARGHVESKGALESIIRFGKDSPQSVAFKNGQCLQCHEKGQRMFWQGSTHESRGVSCVSCHRVMSSFPEGSRFAEPPHDNREFVKQTQMEVCFQCHQMRRAQLMRSSHMPFREGKMTCSSCHNPHGSPNPKLLVAATANETCYTCHAERRGPFLWEHPPVMENCMNCHDAHGSSNPQLLKARTPRLCQRCHIETRHPTTPQSPATRFAFNRGCTNCHSQIHGSNHPSGVRFHR